MFSTHGTLWPIHPKPFRDEILSSWLSRIGNAFGLSLHNFGKASLPSLAGAAISRRK
jgi:hypothetical protein